MLPAVPAKVFVETRNSRDNRILLVLTLLIPGTFSILDTLVNVRSTV